MRTLRIARFLLAVVCTWQTAYQICDRYGDTFKAAAALASLKGPAVATPPSEDADACMPLTIGRTLVPGQQTLIPRLVAFHGFGEPPTAYIAATPAIDQFGRSPPHQQSSVLNPPPKRLSLLALAAVGSLAPPAA